MTQESGQRTEVVQIEPQKADFIFHKSLREPVLLHVDCQCIDMPLSVVKGGMMI